MVPWQHLGARRPRRPEPGTWIRALIVGLAYFAAGRFIVVLNDPVFLGAGFWPGAGIAVGALLISPRRAWPVILAAVATAELVNDLSFGYGLGAIVWWMVANVVEALLVAVLLQRWSADRLDTVRAIGRLLLVTATAGVLAGSIGAIGTVTLGSPYAYPIIVGKWAMGDALGIVTVAPAIVLLRERATRRSLVRPEPLGVLIATAVVTILVFEVWQTAWNPGLPYLVLPLTVWAAVRYRVAGAAVASLIVAQIANVATATGQGPFVFGGLSDDAAIVMLQVFLATATITALLLGARTNEVAAHAEDLEAESLRARAGEATAELYRRVLDEAPAAVFVKDGAGRYLLANLAVANVFDRSREEVVGRTDAELIPDLADRLAASDAEVRRSGARHESEEVLPTSEGPRTFFTVRFPVLAPGHGEGLVAGIATDVSDRRELEQRLAMAERLETVGELAGGIAHDFNNLLIVIAGMTQLALDASEADGRVVEPLREVLHATERASQLGRRLLTFARREPVDPEGRCVADQVVNRLRGLLHPLLLEHTTLELVLEAGDTEVPLPADRFEQILLNLAVNARDAMPDGGTLTICTERIEVHTPLPVSLPPVQPGSYVRVTVADTGAGMTANVREHALEPFFTTKPPGRGTGLGLASVYGSVTAVDGSIDVDSDPGIGTTVRMWFPVVVDGGHPAQADEEDDVAAGEGQVVLVVEDDPSVRDLITRQLRSGGYVVHEAASLAQVSGSMDEYGSLDLLLCDVVLTDGAGPEVEQLVHLRHPSLPVLYMSGYTERTWTGRGRLVPDDRLLSKPFTAVALRRAVAASLARERHAPGGGRVEEPG